MMMDDSRSHLCDTNKFGFIAGLPRTGSTAIATILGSKPDVHVTSGGVLAKLMFGVHEVCSKYAAEGLTRARRTDFPDVLLAEVPRLFYADVKEPFVVVKDRGFGFDSHNLLRHITAEPRVLILLRSVPEIVRSFVYVKVQNGDVLPERDLLEPNVDPLLDTYWKTIKALESGDRTYLFGTYDQFIASPRSFLSAVTRHFRWPDYDYPLSGITDLNLEDDEAMHTQGLHAVRSTVSRRTFNVRVSKGLMKRASELDEYLWDTVRISVEATPKRHI